jgi:uncharacterized repeat protein (TIGR01451 family)
MYAMVNVQQYQIVETGGTVAECEANYRQELAHNGLIEENESAVEEPNTDFGPAEFEITEIRTVNIDGDTHYFLGAGRDEATGRETYYQLNAADDPRVAFFRVGDSVMLVYEAAVNAFAPADIESTILNTASLTGGGLSSAVTDTAQIAAASEASLTITKSLCPETVAENGQITYTFVIQNTGNTPAEAADGVVLRDTFDPILDPISVTYNGTAVTTPAFYTYDAATGDFATVAGAITVPAATYAQDPTTGIITTTPGVAVVRVTGTV